MQAPEKLRPSINLATASTLPQIEQHLHRSNNKYCCRNTFVFTFAHPAKLVVTSEVRLKHVLCHFGRWCADINLSLPRKNDAAMKLVYFEASHSIHVRL